MSTVTTRRPERGPRRIRKATCRNPVCRGPIWDHEIPSFGYCPSCHYIGYHAVGITAATAATIALVVRLAMWVLS